MRNWVLFVATGAGSGYAPLAPGTAGSLVGLALCFALAPLGSPLWIPAAALLVSAAGVWAAARAERLLGQRDDGRIVVDEVAGMLLAVALLPARAEVLLLGFALFRLFDIAKPPPARAAERLPGGLGVMADDWVAALYANASGQLVWRVLAPGVAA